MLLLLPEKGVYKIVTVEHAELVDTLANAYVAYGDMELVADADYHTSLAVPSNLVIVSDVTCVACVN